MIRVFSEFVVYLINPYYFSMRAFHGLCETYRSNPS